MTDKSSQPDSRLQTLDNNEELGKKLDLALESLSISHRECLQYVAEGMTYQEIAKAQKVSVGTVMSRLFYARKKAQRLCYSIRNYNQNL